MIGDAVASLFFLYSPVYVLNNINLFIIFCYYFFDFDSYNDVNQNQTVLMI